MEIKKLDCPSCGAPLEWNALSCNFCKTEVRYFENNSAALPKNLTKVDINNNIILFERDFWNATVNAIKAPYSRYKKFKHYNEQHFKNDFFNQIGNGELFTMFYESFFIFPSENFILLLPLNSIGSSALLTSLRLVIIRDTTLLSIPLDRFISWGTEKSASGSNVLGRSGKEYVGQGVLRYIQGDKETLITFDADDLHILPEIMQSVISSKEWEDLNPLQKNLITANRYNISKSYQIQIDPLVLMEFKKKGCFVATATMGDYNHPTVLLLQDFRDTHLINKIWGRSFINWYYTNGPYIANVIEKSLLLKKISYWIIIKPLVLISKIVKQF